MSISSTLRIPLSTRCEIVLALAYRYSRDNVVGVAHRLANGQERYAIRAAEKLSELPADEASRIVTLTLEQRGLIRRRTT